MAGKTFQSPWRRNRLIRELVHDPYRARRKLREATRCPDCGAQYRNGRWIWPKSRSTGLKVDLCPACLRVADDYPAGEVWLSGPFLDDHLDEILSRIRNIEQSELAEHPLHRIMAVDRVDDEIVVSTTDIHLPHQIGHALKDAWGGELKTHYDREGYFARVHWSRND